MRNMHAAGSVQGTVKSQRRQGWAWNHHQKNKINLYLTESHPKHKKMLDEFDCTAGNQSKNETSDPIMHNLIIQILLWGPAEGTVCLFAVIKTIYLSLHCPTLDGWYPVINIGEMTQCQEKRQSSEADTDMIQRLEWSNREFMITVINMLKVVKWKCEWHTRLDW